MYIKFHVMLKRPGAATDSRELRWTVGWRRIRRGLNTSWLCGRIDAIGEMNKKWQHR